MGLYYIYCTRCNSDGSFNNVNTNCGQCSGTGKDYIDDNPEERENLLRKCRGMGRNGEDLKIKYDPNVDSSSSINYREDSKSEASSSNWFVGLFVIGVLIWLFGK